MTEPRRKQRESTSSCPLLRALGQGEQAKTFYEQSLLIIERLARDEPDRADYQRDLAVSFERMGDLFVSLSQPDGAKEFFQQALAIRERVTQNEPEVAEYQKELVVPLIRLSQFEPEKAASLLRRALSILTGLKERGILLPVYEPWIDGVQGMLDSVERR